MLLGALLLLGSPLAAQAAKPWVGVALGKASGGVRVTRVLPTSPAAQAGLKKGDLITFVNGIQVLNPRDVLRITGKASVGQLLRFKVTRGGHVLQPTLKVGARPKLAKLIKLLLVNNPAPDFSLPLVNRSGSLKLSSLRGKVVLLYFWASWCDSCKLNMPRLKQLHRKYAPKGLVIYSMGRDKQRSTLTKTARDLGLPFPVGYNQGNKVGLLYKSRNVPTLIVVDRKGIVREYIQGSSFSFTALERTLRKLL
jgi:peroxiredoxin